VVTAATAFSFSGEDPNMKAAGLLFDMAELQGSERSRFGYKRAAKAIVALPAPVDEVVRSGAAADVPYIGPASLRVLEELILQGSTATVDAAVAASTRRAEIERRRRMREGFISHYVMQQAHTLPLPASIVGAAQFRGDFQMHSTWSDGAERIATMAEACLGLGHTCMGITDHSHGLPVARGMSMDAARRQGQEIDRLNERYRGRFRIFKGIEANIRGDGSLDLTREERQAFEFVVASPHALLRRDEDQTARMLAAVRASGVAMLGHPRGRMYNTRPGVTADWRRVFEAAAERDVAIELDGNWHRQDIDWRLARVALDAGCLFALDSDAHDTQAFIYTDTAIAHARLAGIPASHVINCWDLPKLIDWLDNLR
jgi:histidinol phosphatase-like PHP family hydrolase